MTMRSMITTLQRQLLVLLIIFISGILGVITVQSLSFDETDLRPQFEANLDVAADLLKSKLQSQLEGDLLPKQVSGLFRDTLQIEKEIIYLAVIDKAGKLVIESGLRPAGLGEGKQILSKHHVGEQVIRTLTLSLGPNMTDMRLLVGAGKNQLGDHIHERIMFLLAALLILLWVSVEIVRFLFSISVKNPLAGAWGLMGRIGAGDFRGRLAPTSETVLSPFIHTLNKIIARVNNHFVYMETLAGNLEEQNTATSEQTKKRLGAHLSQLLNRFHFAEGGTAQVMLARAPEDTRAVLFLFVFAEALTRSFFPQFAASIPAEFVELPVDMFIALPISLFLLSSVLMMAFSEPLHTRLGPRQLLIIGALISVVGFIGTAFTESGFGLMAWRGLSGIAYGVIIATCQAYVARLTSEDDWAEGLCAFLMPLSIGALLGVSMGGILAEHLPFDQVFLVSAAISLIGVLFCFVSLEKPPEQLESSPPHRMNFSWMSDFTNLRFLMFMTFGAIPTRLMMTAILLYLTPLYLSGSGFGFPAIGAVLMVYFLFTAFGTPLLARLADKYNLQVLPVFAGGLISGAVMLSLGQWQNGLTLTIVIGFLGIGHTLINAPLISALPKISGVTFQSSGPSAGLSLYRVCEGVGAIAGPIVAAVLSMRFGYAETIFYLACFSLVSAFVFGGYFLFAKLVPEAAVQDPLPNSPPSH